MFFRRATHANTDAPSKPLPNFNYFEDLVARHMKCSKSLISHQQALTYAMPLPILTLQRAKLQSVG